MLPMVVAGGLCIGFLLLLVSKRLKSRVRWQRRDADWWWFSLCADGAGTGRLYAFSIADRPGLTPGLIGGMLGSAPVLASLVVLLRASWLVTCEVNQYAIETATEYGGAETDLIIPLISSLVVGLAMIYLIVNRLLAFSKG